ncbi:MAG: response regulator [bacterium]
MHDTSIESFRQMLTHRLDALRIAMDKCVNREPEAPSIIRSLASSLLGSANGHATTTIEQAATAVLRAPDERLGRAAATLLRAMRQALARPDSPATILVIGGDPIINDSLVERLTTDNRCVRCAWTAKEGMAILHKEEVVFIILNLFLPDADGRAVLTELRESSATATIPLLVVDEINAGDWIRNHALLLGADGYVAAPVDMDKVIEQVRLLLRRAHHTVNGPRRDPLTGLLNRAALRESYQNALKTCQSAGEPLSLALLTVTSADPKIMAAQAWDDVMQRVGLIASRSIRSTDILARWGVNEFAMMFTGADRACALIALEKVIKKADRDCGCGGGDAAGSLCVCGGVIQLRESEPFAEAMDRVDKCLFAAQARSGGVVSDHSAVAVSPRRALLFHEFRTARLLKQLLIKQGIEAITLESLPDGFFAAPDMKRLHLVVIDEQVDGGGLKVLAALRQVRAFDRVPVLMLLDRNSETGLVRALEMGASDYLTAPFTPEVFIKRVCHLISTDTQATQRAACGCDILIADDDPTTLINAASALYQHGGISICLARGGCDAMERFHADRPGIVILDPMITLTAGGMELLDAILKECDDERTTVIAAMGAGCTPEKVAAVTARVKGVIRKPYNPLSLAREVESISGITLSSDRPPGAARHLAGEIDRLMHRVRTQSEQAPV